MLPIILLAAMQFIPPNEPLLNQVAKEVPPENILLESYQNTFSSMKELALSIQGETGTCVGIAAPQIGIGERFFLMDINVSEDRTKKHIPKHQIYINPIITKQSDETSTLPEGCFSTGNITSLVPRSNEIWIEAYEENGKLVKRKLTGYTARIFQHELDHLNGVRPPERVAHEQDLHYVTKNQIQDYRKNWKQWDQLSSFSEWHRLKEGL